MSVHATEPADRKPVTLPRLLDMKKRAEPIAVLTCYDAGFAALLDAHDVDVLLIGDSLGMVVQGRDSTLPVALDDVAYHVRCVASTTRRAWIVADMPFGTYNAEPERALDAAIKLMQAGARMVKLEGGAWLAPTVELFVRTGIPVCAHLGLTPQSVHALGGYRVQGRSHEAAERMKHDAIALQDAGATMLVLELVPAPVAADLTAALTIPTIGIGAGERCDGQVLVLHDMLGVTLGRKPRFVRDFVQGASSIGDAVDRFVKAVKSREYPAPEHRFDA